MRGNYFFSPYFQVIINKLLYFHLFPQRWCCRNLLAKYVCVMFFSVVTRFSIRIPTPTTWKRDLARNWYEQLCL